MPLGVQQSIAADLRAIPREMRKEMTPAIKSAAQPVLAKARTNASWSSRIPGAIRLKVLYGRRQSGVMLVVSSRKAPHARAYEGATPGAREFRHPVFGHRDRWVSQATRPYAWPAVRSEARNIQRAVQDVVDRAARNRGFR